MPSGGPSARYRMVTSRPSRGQAVNSSLQVAFLKQYGYITVGSNSQIGSERYEHALKQFQVSSLLVMNKLETQEMYGLNQTGKLDPYTKAAMKEPRCGMRDVLEVGSVALQQTEQ